MTKPYLYPAPESTEFNIGAIEAAIIVAVHDAFQEIHADIRDAVVEAAFNHWGTAQTESDRARKRGLLRRSVTLPAEFVKRIGEMNNLTFSENIGIAVQLYLHIFSPIMNLSQRNAQREREAGK